MQQLRGTSKILFFRGFSSFKPKLKHTFGVGVLRLHCRLLKPSSAASTERCDKSAVLVRLAILLRAMNHTEQASGEASEKLPELQDAQLSGDLTSESCSFLSYLSKCVFC